MTNEAPLVSPQKLDTGRTRIVPPEMERDLIDQSRPPFRFSATLKGHGMSPLGATAWPDEPTLVDPGQCASYSNEENAPAEPPPPSERFFELNTLVDELSATLEWESFE